MSSILSHLRRGFAENVRFAMMAVRAHKLRAGLTVLGIVVGVATVISMVSIVTGFNNGMVRQFQSFGATLVQFQKFSMRFGPGHRSDLERNRKDLTLEDALALKAQIPEIRAVSPERYLWDTNVSVKYRATNPRRRRSRALSRLLAREQPLRRARAVHRRRHRAFLAGRRHRAGHPEALFPNESP
jgi:putative ABC transport system permease protein